MQRSTVNHMIRQLESEIEDLCNNRTAKYLEMTKKRRQALHHCNMDQTLNKCVQENKQKYEHLSSNFEEVMAQKQRLLIELRIYLNKLDHVDSEEDNEEDQEVKEDQEDQEDQEAKALREYKIRKYKEHLDRVLNNTRRSRQSTGQPRARERLLDHLTDDQMVAKYDKIVASRRKYYNKVKSSAEYKAKQKEYKAKYKRTSSSSSDSADSNSL